MPYIQNIHPIIHKQPQTFISPLKNFANYNVEQLLGYAGYFLFNRFQSITSH